MKFFTVGMIVVGLFLVATGVIHHYELKSEAQDVHRALNEAHAPLQVPPSNGKRPFH